MNVFALGVCRENEIFYARASGIGNPVIYVGAKTGRDGIHGASMASAEFTEESKQKRPERSGGRSVPRKAAARSLPRGHEDRRHRRHSGHGRGGPHFLLLRNGQPRRSRHRYRSGPCPAARNRHDRLRNAALRIPGAHAARSRKGPGGRGVPGLPQVGPRCGHHRRGNRQTGSCACAIKANVVAEIPNPRAGR